MKLSKIQAATPEVIEFINNKMAEGQEITDILLVEFKQKTITKRVADKVEAIKKMIKESGYILEGGFYKIREKETKNIKDETDKSQQSAEQKSKKNYLTKKQKAELEEQRRREREERLKENPYLNTTTWDLLKQVDYIASDIGSGKFKQVGVYMNTYVEEAFAPLQNRFYYIPNYLLINACVRYTEENLNNFIESKWVDKFTEIYHKEKLIRKIKSEKLNELKEEKKEITKKLSEISKHDGSVENLKDRLRSINSELRRKQTNVKMSTYIADTSMYFLKEKFPFLSQSDIILMCVYSFSKCFNNELEKVKNKNENSN